MHHQRSFQFTWMMYFNFRVICWKELAATFSLTDTDRRTYYTMTQSIARQSATQLARLAFVTMQRSHSLMRPVDPFTLKKTAWQQAQLGNTHSSTLIIELYSQTCKSCIFTLSLEKRLTLFLILSLGALKKFRKSKINASNFVKLHFRTTKKRENSPEINISASDWMTALCFLNDERNESWKKNLSHSNDWK